MSGVQAACGRVIAHLLLGVGPASQGQPGRPSATTCRFAGEAAACGDNGTWVNAGCSRDAQGSLHPGRRSLTADSDQATADLEVGPTQAHTAQLPTPIRSHGSQDLTSAPTPASEPLGMLGNLPFQQFLSGWFCGIKCIHIVVQTLPRSLSRTFHVLQLNLCPH